MNSVFKNIQFETELAEDFTQRKLPTLDFEMWFQKDGKKNEGRKKILYRFYEKPMNTPFSIMKKSAMPEGGKVASLSQEVVRRMLNTSEMLDQNERDQILNNYTKKLFHSGYEKHQVKEILESGLKGYEKKLEKAKKENRNIHREACDTIKTRQRKKLLAKTTWYKKKKENNESKKDGQEGKKRAGDTDQNKQITPIVSVMFVPRTEGGELAKRLRQEEEIISKITGNKVKIQEKSGTMIQRILHKSDPWSKEPCDRPDCLVCMGEDNAGECKRRNVLYRTSCLRCKEKGTERFYFGETARSAYERGREHLADFKEMSIDSHMVKHAVVEHQGDTDIKFGMKVLKVHMTAFRRQIHEAVKIQRSQNSSILNSKGEYNCCSLPRLTVMVGDKEANREKEKEEKDPLTEEEIEQEIIKIRNKKRKEMNDGPRLPPSKKRKRWRIELRKELKEKRKRDYSQAEKDIENIERSKKRKITNTEEENLLSKENLPRKENLSDPETEETDAHKHSQQAISNINENNLKIPSESKPKPMKNETSLIDSEKNLHFPIFQFTASRQKGKGNCHNYKANSKPSHTTTRPPERITPKMEPKSNPTKSSTLKQPKQVQNRSRGPKFNPCNYKKISQYFNPISENENEKILDAQTTTQLYNLRL